MTFSNISQSKLTDKLAQFSSFFKNILYLFLQILTLKLLKISCRSNFSKEAKKNDKIYTLDDVMLLSKRQI